MKEHFKDWERKKFVGTHSPCRCCGCRDVLKTAGFACKPGYVWIVVTCAFCENSRGGYYRKETEYHAPIPETKKEAKMTHAEEKMAEEICSLRASLRSVSDRLEAVLESGFPAKGRSQDDKESSEQWWEDNHSAVNRAREVLRDTAEYDGVLIAQHRLERVVMADGKGCVCNAHGECECACDADWTPQELIDARAEIVRLRAASSKRLDEIAADMPRWKTLTLLQQLRDKGPAMKCVPMFAVKAMRHAASMIESYQQHDAELETACHQSELDYQAEIERLRLTDDEREAINMSRRILVSEPSMNPAQRAEWAITLSRLLDRTGVAK